MLVELSLIIFSLNLSIVRIRDPATMPVLSDQQSKTSKLILKNETFDHEKKKYKKLLLLLNEFSINRLIISALLV